MALKDYEASRGKVAGIQNRLNQTVESIRNNKAYSDSGRRAEMAKATLLAKKEAAALKAEFLADREAQRKSLQKRLFGILGEPTHTELIVMRDSQERADAIKDEETALRKLRRADQSGDTYMAKAIAERAVEKGWRSVVDTYAENAPLGTRTALEALADIPSGLRTNLADAATFTIRAPAELGGANDAVLEVYTRGDDNTAQRLTSMLPRGGVPAHGA